MSRGKDEPRKLRQEALIISYRVTNVLLDCSLFHTSNTFWRRRKQPDPAGVMRRIMYVAAHVPQFARIMFVRFLSYTCSVNLLLVVMAETRMSSKGQVVIPKQVRESKGWNAGQAFRLVEEGDAVRLEPIPTFSRTSVEEVAGCLAYDGPPIPVEQIHGGRALRERKRSSERDA